MCKTALIAVLMGAAMLNASALHAAGEEYLPQYLGKMQEAIRGRLKDWDSYQGKTCTIRANFSRDAMLMGAKSEGGDPAFCAAMLDSLKTVKFPKFPNDDVYAVFKNALMDFKA